MEHENNVNRRRRSLRYAIGAGLLVFVLIGACIGLLQVLSWQARRDAIRRDLIHCAEEVAQLVQGNLHAQLTGPEQTESELHRNLLAPLVHYHRQHPHLYYIFTMIVRDGDYFFILDTATDPTAPKLDEDVQASAIMEPYEFLPDEATAIRRTVLEEGRPYTRDDFFIGSFGTFVTGFAPILDESGRPVAIAGVDLSLASFETEFADLHTAAIASWSVAALVSLLVGLTVYLITLQNAESRSALESSRQRYRDLVNLLPACVLEIDDRGVVSFANDYTFTFTGRTRDAILQASMSKLLDPEGQEALHHALQLARDGGTPEARQLVLITASGEERHVVGRIGRGVDDTGALRLRVLLLDVTDRVRLERHLRQSEKLEAIGQLAGGVAHDFNNQLAIILGFIDLVAAENGLTDRGRQQCEFIRDAARKSSTLAGQLLSYARRGDFQREPLDLHRLLDHTRSILEHSLDKKIRISLQPAAGGPYVLGDAVQIENALLNLAINARDAMPTGGTFEFHTEDVLVEDKPGQIEGETAQPGAYVLLSVRDDGLGMEPAVRERIFEPFFTTKPAGEGTGMGLASVYGTIRNHNGLIFCDSVAGRGTEFRIYLPTCTAPAQTEPEEVGTEQPADPDVLTGRSILVIDDEHGVAEAARSLLESFGCLVTVENNPRNAVLLFQERAEEFDLVLLDLIMPELSGVETFAALRQRNPRAQILLMSGFSLSEESQHLLRHGAVGLIRKPFDRRSLQEHLCQAFQRRVSETAAVAKPAAHAEETPCES